MPKKLLATVMCLATILVAVVSTIGVEVVNANPIPQSTMGISSPLPITRLVYQNTTIPLTIQLDLCVADTSRTYSPQITHINYSLDVHSNITITDIPQSGPESSAKDLFGRETARFVTISVNAMLSNLSEGQHTLKAYAFDNNSGVMSDSVTFAVLTSYSIPEVTIISPQDQVYRTSEIPLTCAVKGDYEQLSYAIDYRSNVTIGRNTTISISELPNGCHTITVYATTPGRYGGSSWTYFIVGTINYSLPNPTAYPTNPAPSPTQTSTPTPTTSSQNTPTINTGLQIKLNLSIFYIILAIVIVIIAVASTSLIYYKKRNVI